MALEPASLNRLLAHLVTHQTWAGTEVCGEFLAKVRHVYLEGRFQTRIWKGPEGDKRTAIGVAANQMQILDPAPKNGNGAKTARFSKRVEPVDEGDNPFAELGSEAAEQGPF